jgi:CRP-like cAMP-binding protein
MQPDRRSTQTDLAQLEPFGTRHAFKRHTVMYTPDQSAQTLFLLRAGQVTLQLISGEGRALTIQVIEAGQLFGHLALVAQARYDTSAEASKPGELIAVGRGQLRRLLIERPPLALALLDELGSYQHTISRRLDQVAFMPVPARLASLLLHMADSDASSSARLPRRTHRQLAEMINAYRETVTKVINQFRAARLLDVDRSGITLLNLSRLRELAQE